MAIRVLIADDSDVVREAMRKLIGEEPRIEIVGEASSFAQTMQGIADFKPDVLLLDLHMAEKRDFTPALVKSQLVCVENILAVSFSNDAEAGDLAESYGAKVLLDKMRLFDELVPAILDCRPHADHFKRNATLQDIAAE
jgi:DNA-binding NarL/FixJ family response regulator